MKLVPGRQLRDRPLPLDRLERNLRLELGREPSPRLYQAGGQFLDCTADKVIASLSNGYR